MRLTVDIETNDLAQAEIAEVLRRTAEKAADYVQPSSGRVMCPRGLPIGTWQLRHSD